MAAETADNDSSQEPPPFAAAAAAAGGPNPCCAKLWKKYQQIEKGRTVLREAVKLLNSEIDKVRNENSSLSEVCKEERLRADSAEAARETESDARDTLEKEVIELKAENSSLHQKQNFSKTNDDLLSISELEEENRRLKQVIGEEKLKRDSERKKVEEAKSKALEAQKLLKSETHKSEEYKRLADTERKIANDLKASCEKLRIEVNEARAQLSAQIQKTGDAHKKADAEKQKAAREKKCADSEKLLAEKNKKLIEVERKKAMEEKIRSNKLVAQLEEQKKLNGSLQVSIEAQRKNAMSEKNRADQLLQKLEEERKRSECLQSKSGNFSATRDMVSLGKHGIQQIDVATESANIRLLKEKLKRKKDQINHMKKESKLEKALIRREIELLKQDWMQPLNRFNMLDDYLAGGVEVPAMKKLKRQPEVHDLDRTLRPHNPVTAPYFGLQAGIVPFTSTPREYTSYQLPRESCTRPISGTSSELEPPIGSALRTESKNHHRSSCPTSDKKFMGSQGKESLFVSSTGIRKNQNSTGSELPPKDGNTRKQDRALLEISGHSSQQKALKSSLPGGTEVADQMPNGRRKRKRTKHSVKSLSHDVTTNDYLAFSDDRSCQQQRNIVIPSITEEGLQKHSRKCHVAFDKSLSDCAKVLSPGAEKACAGSEFASLLTFEKLIEGDCLKLLNLDNDADEEKYRKAMERPLSPDVPIVLPTITRRPMSTHLVDGNNGEYDKDCPASRSVGSLSEVQKLSEKAKFQSPCSRTEHDGTGKELCANNKSNAAYDDPYNTKSVDASVTARLVNVSRENMASNTVVSVAVNSTNTIGPQFSGSSCRGHTSASLHLAPNKSRLSQMFDASSDPELQSNNVGTSKTQIAEPVHLISNSTIGHCHGAENNTVDFVGVSSLKRSSLIKILRYWDALTSEASKLSQDIYVDGPLLERVSTEPLLLPEERVPLIFSLLLWDVRKLTSEPVVGQDFASSAFSMTVKPYMERRLVFLKSNHLDVLISLIEDFLVNKEVMVCDKMGVMNSDASKYCHLDDETDIQVSTKPATINQFISACILLASICVKAERLDVVLEVSYRVLQMGKLNLSWTMLALHVFGSVCCDKLRLLESCNLLMTTIRLVVLLLESTDASSCLVSSYIQSNRSTAFQSCTHCVFDVDTVSIDVFISSLLDELHLCALSWNNRTNSNEAITREISHLGSSGLELSCGETCNISKRAKLTEGTNYPAGRDLCYFSEIISLLELFGSYMSCQWTYKNVVVRLLKILESCTCEEYSAALLVLVSHLGRFFIDDVGYETESVVELRNKLAVLIGTSFTISRSIPVQFSAIGALLSLFPLTFDKIIASQTGPLSGRCVVQASQISEWFAQLSKENQSFACSFFS